MALRIVYATAEHASLLMDMIKELAEFEKIPHGPTITIDRLADDLSKEHVFGLVAYEGETPVGMSLYYLAYSTWEGQFIHMEDLYVRPDFRKKGYGKALWSEIAKLSKEKGMTRLEWSVLNWNTNAIDFYKQMGAKDLHATGGWLNFRLGRDGIVRLAANAQNT
uniref:N-acetyltransferase domain-containing protein n=1 Tax=Plectus sambesii TaxID=2011161 RepID=A0A914WUM1_9BILA